MTKYQLLNNKERDEVIIKIVEKLLDPYLPFSGKHRKEEWERGWQENLIAKDTKPRYFGKYNVFRQDGKFVYGVSENYEQESLYLILDELAEKYLFDYDTICEFGCGTGHNLLRLRNVKPDARYIGLDWTKSSNDLVRSLGMEGYNFDYFNPAFEMPHNAAIYTVASLEQTGKKYKKFVKYLLKNKPSIIVHIEPIPELLDATKLEDYLSIKYMEKRKYLSGYLDYLRSLEKRGFIKILEARRSGIGSLFIDGYSVIVWKPL